MVRWPAPAEFETRISYGIALYSPSFTRLRITQAPEYLTYGRPQLLLCNLQPPTSPHAGAAVCPLGYTSQCKRLTIDLGWIWLLYYRTSVVRRCPADAGLCLPPTWVLAGKSLILALQASTKASTPLCIPSMGLWAASKPVQQSGIAQNRCCQYVQPRGGKPSPSLH